MCSYVYPFTGYKGFDLLRKCTFCILTWADAVGFDKNYEVFRFHKKMNEEVSASRLRPSFGIPNIVSV